MKKKTMMLILNDYRNNFKHFFTLSKKKKKEEGRENILITHTHIWKAIMLNFRETRKDGMGLGEGVRELHRTGK